MAENTVDYLLVGHITADLTPDGRLLGGTVSYAAKTAKAFGLRVAALTSAGHNDPLLDELRREANVVCIPAEHTSTFENIYGPQGRIQYIRGVAASILPAHIPPAWLTAPLVHIAPLTDEVAPEVVFQFPNAITLLTLQGWLRRWDDDGRVRFKYWCDRDVLSKFSFIVFSEEDIIEAPGLEQEIASFAPRLIVTRADKGGTYYHNGESFSYTTPQVEALHPTGAGDIFAASLLSAYHQLNHDLYNAVHAAAHLAAISVTRPGLTGAPSPDEVRVALENFSKGSA